MRRGHGMRGHTLVELMTAIALLGMIVVAAAPITTYLLHQASVEPLLSADFEVGFGVVPAVREDVRGAVAAVPRLGPLRAGRGGIVLDRGEEAPVRAVVYRVEAGVVRRAEYRQRNRRYELVGERRWRGDFFAWFLVEDGGAGRLLVGLEVVAADLAAPRIASFRFGLRR